MQDLTQFTYEDFSDSTKPYEYIYQFENDKFTQARELEKLSKVASRLGYRNFKRTYKEYLQKLQKASGKIYQDSTTQFEGQEVELGCGQWRADEFGITKEGQFGEVCACNHPILPVERLVNIDTGEEKLRLAYRKGKQWRHVVMDKETLASSNKILALAKVGVAVNSENSKYLVQYLHDVEAINYDVIPEKSSVSRLGWIDGEGFSPYVGSLVFDGEANYRTFFNSVKPCGEFDSWLSLARKVRKGSVFSRIILASSFASVLVKLIGELCFIVHLWGGTESGKTVGLMLAASVWADPSMGKYIRTFNGTSVSQELSAGFVNSLPLILDEFQMVKNKKEFEQSVYMLCEGVGKNRGAKAGGLQYTHTWRNCTLSSGETPITVQSSGGGAVNRIVDIECTSKLFENPRHVADTVRKHYGHAGKKFVEKLQEDGTADRVRKLYSLYYDEILKQERTDKQALAGAIILTADALATEWIFRDGQALEVEDIQEFLQSKREVDVNERAYHYLCERVAANANRFHANDNGEVWGRFEGENVCIIRSIFDQLCEDGSFNSRSVLSWMVRNGVADGSGETTSGRKMPTKVIRMNGAPVRCVVMHLQQEREVPFSPIDDMEF